MLLKLMYITNSLPVALIAEKNGVERVWVDLETRGKEERQKGRDSVKSHHKVSDIAGIAPHLTTSKMLVRINPCDENSPDEINQVIQAGADIVMLPMYKTVKEASDFIEAIDNRARNILLLETKEAEQCLDEVLELEGLDEIHIGLNDLHLSYGLTFMFELLANGTVERICRKIAAKGIPYGFGGIAKIGDGAVPAEKIILEHYRLGSTRAILSRTFCDNMKFDSLDELERVFTSNMKAIRDFEKYAECASASELEANHREVEQAVACVAESMKRHRAG